MSQKITMNKESAQLFERLLERGHIVGDGKATRPIMRALNDGTARKIVYAGYVDEPRKVILAMRKEVQIIRKRRTLNSVLFDLDF